MTQADQTLSLPDAADGLAASKGSKNCVAPYGLSEECKLFVFVWEFLRFFPASSLYFITRRGRTKGTPHFFLLFLFLDFYLLKQILCVLYLSLNRSWLMTLLAQTASISHTLSALKNSSKDVAPRLLRRESFLHSCFSSPSGIPLGWLRIPTQRIPVCAVSDCSEQPLTSLLLPAASGSNSINRCLWVRL